MPILTNTIQKQRLGEVFAVGLTLIEAWFPIFAFFSVTALGGLHAYFYSLLIAVFFLALWWWLRGRQKELRTASAYRDLALTALFITLLFSLTFSALQYTSATNVAIILFLQILFTYLFLGRRQEERLDRRHLIGAVLMTVGAVLVLFPGEIAINRGDLLVLLAAMIAPVANFYQKKSRAQVSSETILLVRSLVALPFIYLFASIFEPNPGWSAIQAQWLWLFLTGFLVFFIGKIWWVEAIHRLPIAKVNALFAIAPLMTMGLAYWVLDEVPTWWQLAGVMPILLGGYWITRK